MCFGLLIALVKFKIGVSVQNFCLKTGILSYPACTYNNAYSLYTFLLTLKTCPYMFLDRFI